jgi:D-3-phosphoglycerate dehydrogenase / 2-oxoglutarate reductase
MLLPCESCSASSILIVSTYPLSEKTSNLLKEFDLVNGSEKKEEVSNAAAILCWPDSLRRVISFAGPKLEVIQTFSAGVDDLPFEKIPETVKIFSNAGAYSQSVSEHALALILALCKNVGRKDPPNSYPLDGKTVTILGGGGIGSTVARIAKKGFGLRVMGVSRSFKNPENFDEVLSPDRLEYALTSADIIVCALPLNKYTRNLLDYDKLVKTKKMVAIANVGRAEAINEADIYRMLLENPDARFATDVFWRANSKENFDSKLWQLQNFAGTLHRAGATASPEVKETAIEIAASNLRNYFLRSGVRNLVDRSDYLD